MLKKRLYSHYCQDAAQLFSQLIQSARKEKKMSTAELAQRAGISRRTLHKIEHASLTCELGLVFEVAMIVGVTLFELNPEQLSREVEQMRYKLTLLPARVRSKERTFDDNF